MSTLILDDIVADLHMRYGEEAEHRLPATRVSGCASAAVAVHSAVSLVHLLYAARHVGPLWSAD